MTLPPPNQPGPVEWDHQATQAASQGDTWEPPQFGPADLAEALLEATHTRPGRIGPNPDPPDGDIRGDLAQIWAENSARMFTGRPEQDQSAPTDTPAATQATDPTGPVLSPWWSGRPGPGTDHFAPWGLLTLPFSPLGQATGPDINQVLEVCWDMLSWRRAISDMSDTVIPDCWMHHPDLVEAIWEWARSYQATHHRGVDGTAGIIWLQQTHWLLKVWLAENSWARDCLKTRSHQPTHGYGTVKRDHAYRAAWAGTGPSEHETWIWPPPRPAENEQDQPA